ncbi:hypothetical protein APSETT444_006560 [Aspergillus pseudonomiae]
MASKTTVSLSALYLMFGSFCLGKTADMSAFNNPSHGPPAADFAAADSLPVSVLQAAAAAASIVPKDATYPFSLGSSEKSTIHSDWVSFKEGAALSWVADMDVDCDGVNHKCEVIGKPSVTHLHPLICFFQGNQDGQPQTNWGALSAYAVPYIVIPDRFLAANKDILPGNNIAAVICNGKMYYGILGDSNGDDPQITGEASWLMAKTCFPNDNLQGNNAHSSKDVTCKCSCRLNHPKKELLTNCKDILFTGERAVLPDNVIDKTYITDFDTLRTMGDKLARALASNLGTPNSTESESESASAAASLWAGREGAYHSKKEL